MLELLFVMIKIVQIKYLRKLSTTSFCTDLIVEIKPNHVAHLCGNVNINEK